VKKKKLALRWLKFHFVGGIGIAVQLVALQLLIRAFHVEYLLATAAAVELAVLHNFVWHERFTWKERAGGPWRSVAGRLLRFHAGNGLVSIAGNVALMRLFVGGIGMRPLPANAIAVAVCSLLNFAASEWFVFRESG
jgi:putative flippase GtrA